jgi:superoxide dismutase, Fe-Mn family
MRYNVAPLYCRPWTLNGITPHLIESHYENDYGSALNRLNVIADELDKLDLATTPAHVVSRLKRDEAAALNSTLLHELYFASLGGDGRAVPAEMADAIVRDFGSVLRWRREFIALAESLAGGSGWVLLTYVPRDERLINQSATDHSQSISGGISILAIDMYEHAYHLDFGANALSERDQGRSTAEARAEAMARPAHHHGGGGQVDARRWSVHPDHRHAAAALHREGTGHHGRCRLA